MHYYSYDAVSIPAVVILMREDQCEAVYGFYESMGLAREVASYLIRHHILADDIRPVVMSQEEFVYGR